MHNKYLRKPMFYGHQFRTIRNRFNNVKKTVKKITFKIFSIKIVKKNLEVINLIFNREKL